MTPTSAPVIRQYVDTVLVAPARLRDTRDIKALGEAGHAIVRHQKDRGNVRRWEDESGHHYRARRRIRPGVKVGSRTYRSPLHLHQLDAEAMAFVRAAQAHSRLVVLRLDVALDIWCESQNAADALHDELRHGVFLSGARGGVRVSHATAVSTGTTYMGVAKGEEGAVLTIYSDHHAAKKNGGVPTCHVELRLFGARVVRAAVGRALDIEKSWSRVRLVEDLSHAPRLVRRAAQNAGPRPYAQDVADVMCRHGLDRRPVLGRAVPLRAWVARRKFARGDHSPTVVAGGCRSTQYPGVSDPVESPTRAMTFPPTPMPPPAVPHPASPPSVQPTVKESA